MSSVGLLVAGIGSTVLAGVASLFLQGYPRMADRLYRLLVSLGLAAIAGTGVAALVDGSSLSATVTSTVPGGPWVVRVDGLAGWFLILLGVVGIAATNYGIRYLAAERGHRPVAVAHALGSLLLAAMALVIVAHSVVLFLLAWEIMALCAYFLIMFEGEQREVRRAGLVYLILTHTGTLALMAMFLWWGRAGPDLTFQSLAAAAPTLPQAGGLVLLLGLAGFGGKAGVFPLHFWLPGAHAAAPSHVSALLSAVMLKVGIYGLLRVISLVGPGPIWFGWLLFSLGLLSGILGVLWAVSQHDLKRVLAYSSVENIGIIVLGIGVGVLGTGYHQPVVAALGYLAALLHCLNHALFKGLLFLGAGAVARATGTRIIDRLGGLGRRMPLTAAAFAVGSIAIVGLPPLNGFVSEWVAGQALLHASQSPERLRLVVVGLGGLGLIGALALVCFARLGGSLFLGQPRGAEAATGDDWGLVVPMAGLAATCLLAGAVPGLTVGPALRIVAALTGHPTGDVGAVAFLGSVGAVSALAALVVGLVAAAWLLRRRLGRGFAVRRGPTWGCGYARPTPRMQYTASSFGSPVLRAFGPLAAPPARRTATTLATEPDDRVLMGVVVPFWRRVQSAAVRLRPLQEGRITRYLQYMVVTVVLLLGALFAASVRQP
jgi:hydrogenase-4 component B